MPLENHLLLYMDVLGAKKIVYDNPETLLSLVEYFSSNAREFRLDLSKAPDGMYDFEGLDPTISNFSDHIAISFPMEKLHPLHPSVALVTLINIAIQLHTRALGRGFLMRGAITCGELFHKGNSILGKALVEADELERKTAIYPRVIIKQDVVNIFYEKGSFGFPTLLKRDDADGIYFVDYLRDPIFLNNEKKNMSDEFYSIHSLIKEQLIKFDGDPHLFSKWKWLAIKLNQAIKFNKARCQTYEANLSTIEPL